MNYENNIRKQAVVQTSTAEDSIWALVEIATARKVKRVEILCIALNGNPPQSYGVSPTTWDHTVLPAIQHR